ncbi:hypothetical protein N566_08375 [Streptomycetaceae bacterium MP113-05]|nr:hypothetical protein N566_08375 [Streptomycetaceae bacterium MP113-05]
MVRHYGHARADRQTLEPATRRFRRAAILGGERTSAECVHAAISQPMGSDHLSCLVDCGYVSAAATVAKWCGLFRDV